MSKSKIEKLFNDNPFNAKFTKWEENYTKGNRLIADTIKSNNILVGKKYQFDEPTAVDEESIKRYLANYEYIYDYINTCPNKITLVHDNLIGKSFLPETLKNKPHFILGISTRYKDNYYERLKYYKHVLKNVKNIQIIESKNDEFNTCIIHK